MGNNLNFPNSRKQTSDILDFLDNVKKYKASDDNSNPDIVDIVREFYGLGHKNHPTMSESVKSVRLCEPLNLLTLSRMSTMSGVSESEIEKYQYLYEERAAIYEYEAGFTIEEAEQKSLKDISEIYSKDKNLDLNNIEVINFINQITTN